MRVFASPDQVCIDSPASFATGIQGDSIPLAGSGAVPQRIPHPKKQQNPPCRVHEKIETLPQQGWCPLRCFVLPTSAAPVKRAAGGRSASRQWKFGLHKSSVGPQAHTSRTQQAAVSEYSVYAGQKSFAFLSERLRSLASARTPYRRTLAEP